MNLTAKYNISKTDSQEADSNVIRVNMSHYIPSLPIFMTAVSPLKRVPSYAHGVFITS